MTTRFRPSSTNVAYGATPGPGVPAAGGGGSLTSTPCDGSKRAWNIPSSCHATSFPISASGTM